MLRLPKTFIGFVSKMARRDTISHSMVPTREQCLCMDPSVVILCAKQANLTKKKKKKRVPTLLEGALNRHVSTKGE